jgi:hypothetical protein
MIALELFEYINGITSLILVIVSIIIGAKIMLKYFEFKNKDMFFIGFMWLGVSEIYLPTGVSFLLALFTGVGLPVEIFFLVGNVLLPIVFLSWLMAFTNLVYKSKQKIILSIFAIIGIIFEIFFFYFLFTNPIIIGEIHKSITAIYNPFLLSYLMLMLGVLVITGFIFARESIRSEDPEIKLKGKIQMVAFISVLIGNIINGIIVEEVILMIICRIIMISAIVEFYYGTFLSNWVKKLFLKDKN